MNINLFSDIEAALEELNKKELEAKAIRDKSNAEKKKFDRKRRKELTKARKLEKEVKDWRTTLDYLMNDETQKVYQNLTSGGDMDHHSHIQVDDQQNQSSPEDPNDFLFG